MIATDIPHLGSGFWVILLAFGREQWCDKPFLQFVLAVLVLSLILPRSSQYIKWIVSAGLAQVSEFSFVLGSRARRAGIISREVRVSNLTAVTALWSASNASVQAFLARVNTPPDSHCAWLGNPGTPGLWVSSMLSVGTELAWKESLWWASWKLDLTASF